MRVARRLRVQSSPRGCLGVGRASRALALFRPRSGSALVQLAFPNWILLGVLAHLEAPEPRRQPRFSGRGVSRSNYFEPVLSEACLFEDCFGVRWSR